MEMIATRGKKYKRSFRKKRIKVSLLGLAVLFGAGEWSGSKFGFPGPKFDEEPKSGFDSIGSARINALPDISAFGR